MSFKVRMEAMEMHREAIRKALIERPLAPMRHVPPPTPPPSYYGYTVHNDTPYAQHLDHHANHRPAVDPVPGCVWCFRWRPPVLPVQRHHTTSPNATALVLAGLPRAVVRLKRRAWWRRFLVWLSDR